MTKKYILHNVLVLFILLTFFSKATLAEIINVDTLNISNAINKRSLLGVNTLFWIDDDKTLNNANYKDALKSINISTLRYPGGEVADNFNWKTNSIERPNDFPKEAKTFKQKQNRTDYLEFLAFAREMKIKNLYFVVNVEGAFFPSGYSEERIHLYADRAANWVKSVKKAGYFVPYWEIGNEAYLDSSYPLKAKEYAHILKIFYQKMKQADPRIKIGAVGPSFFKGQAGISFADSFPPKSLLYMREQKLKNIDICKGISQKKCRQNLSLKSIYKNAPLWWNILTTDALYSFDFASLHIYKMPLKGSKDNPKTSPLINFKIGLDQLAKRNVPIAITEWNTPFNKKNLGYHSEYQQALSVASILNESIHVNVQDMLFWPMRMKTSGNSLISINNKSRNISYRILNLYNKFVNKIKMKDPLANNNKLILTKGKKYFSIIYINNQLVPKALNIISNKYKLRCGEDESINFSSETANKPVCITTKEGVQLSFSKKTITGVKILY